ncbi:transcriptional regulator [Arthrobacter sp. AFG7.2]|uniref:winged helix-turn-helix domain-containing protein n=1 Tax=Arthrobacter sp. AFG7.2 TaxID=1688693 RepID=UPI000C9EA7FE|nr:winged helix-turn-helix domain-containing protein [Arthrobacter sp. AFG7.2]PNI08536.1 transcriptional regulator [Arthrobacter sp. AFG7.2]
MTVASGYVHISVRNAAKAGQPSGLRPGFGPRSALAPSASGSSFPSQGFAPQGFNPNSYGQLRAVQPAEAAPMTAPTPVVAGPNAVRAVANDTVARGFVLYMGIDEETAAAAGTSIAKLAQEIRAYAQSLVAGAESYAAVAVAPAGTPGSALDVVRSTFGDPTVSARQRTEAPRQQAQEPRPSGVLIDLARREVHLDGESLNLTFKEFELLNYLVENGTRTVGRDELLEGLWRNAEEVPNERTIDVHIRRLRSKLGRLANTVRTVRGQGYRFYEHPEVVVWAAPEYSI